eukprot:TRINITY_DN10339_c0_g1_i1.p1 TRINITY_DN10339_c0_g1~~TRINITY_DN10339_c0_g1_i1.p1  ORF type:complete len:161 (+),score=31.82 TRINITY_DN10339_c0_g1_i1:47-529(+)
MNKSHTKQEQKRQQEEDNAALNWRSSYRVLNVAREKRTLEGLTSPRRFGDKFPIVRGEHVERWQAAQLLLPKYKKEKGWRYLQEFWKKITNKKDLKGKFNVNPSYSLLWLLAWRTEFRIKLMVQRYEDYEKLFNELPDDILLNREQLALSHFFFTGVGHF